MIGSAARTAARPRQRVHTPVRYQAPVGGIDIRRSLGSEDPRYCVYTYNLIPFEYGMRVRNGFREWQIGVDDGAGVGVHTLIPFDSAEDFGAGDKLFCVTNEGIWDVTVSAAAPISMLTFTDKTDAAGYGTYTHYVDDSGTDVLFYADSLNGLFQYDVDTNTWAQASGITGVDVLKVKFVVSHKQRLWMIERDATSAWYLGIGSISGVAVEFFFGSKFRHGGTLEGLFNWSVDGGAGVDDFLVAVSHSGDVLTYAGADPIADDWGLKGSYYIGQIPNTPRFGSEHGGELYLLSAYGVTSMNDLLRGVDTNVLRADVDGSSMAYRIAGLVRERMKRSINSKGWEVSPLPSDGGILISVPTVGSDAPIQYHYNYATEGWGIWRGVPMLCFEEFEDATYFGTADGRIMRMDVDQDNVLLTPADPNMNGDDIEFSILTMFSSLNAPAQFKSPNLVRPDFVSTQPPQHSSVVRFDYNVAEGVNFDLDPPVDVNLGSTWDTDAWDEAIWSSTDTQTFPSIGAVWGTGRYLAIATKGLARSDTRLVGWDMIYTTGGVMI